MIFGAITNSWRQQLDRQDLADLVQEARARGAWHIELRQTCLGQYEHGEGEQWRPVLSRLASLVQAFPALTFDLAMAWPCLTKHTDPSGEPFQAALQGATLVGGLTPHLRLVDPAAFECPWETPAEIPHAALSVADLAREAARQGVTLSMENSGQPIRSMALVVREARSRLTPDEGQYLGLCPDPTNQLRRYPDSDPLAELEALPADMIKMCILSRPAAAGPTRAWTAATWTVPGCCRYWRQRVFRALRSWKSPPTSGSSTISPPASLFLRPLLAADEST